MITSIDEKFVQARGEHLTPEAEFMVYNHDKQKWEEPALFSRLVPLQSPDGTDMSTVYFIRADGTELHVSLTDFLSKEHGAKNPLQFLVTKFAWNYYDTLDESEQARGKVYLVDEFMRRRGYREVRANDVESWKSVIRVNVNVVFSSRPQEIIYGRETGIQRWEISFPCIVRNSMKYGAVIGLDRLRPDGVHLRLTSPFEAMILSGYERPSPEDLKRFQNLIRFYVKR